MDLQHLQACKGTGQTLTLPAQGFSMRPAIPNGATLLISFVPIDEIHEGEIILFRRNGLLIAHRVLYKKQDADGAFFIEKGDHQFRFGRVNPSAFLGRVSGFQTLNGETRLFQNRGKTLRLMIGRFECLLFALKYKFWGAKPITGSEKFLRLTARIKS